MSNNLKNCCFMCYNLNMADYFTERNIKNLEKIKLLQKKLPVCCNDFLLGIEGTTSVLTRRACCYDMLTFFNFLSTECPRYQNKNIIDFTYEDLDKVTDKDIEQYLSYLSGFKREDGKYYTNSEKTKSRKFACVRAMFKFFYKKLSF